MQQLIISVPNQAAADEVRRAVSTITGVKISLIVPEGAVNSPASKSRSRIATEELAKTLIEGVRDAQRMERGEIPSVDARTFFMEMKHAEDQAIAVL